MPTLNYYLNALGRCTAFYRAAALQDSDVNPGDMPYLFHVCRHPGLTQDALGRALYVNKTAVTRHVTHLEECGFLTRVPCSEDKRALLLHPTQKALDVLPQLREINAAWHAVLTDGFTEEEATQFISLLSRALTNARAKVEEGEK